MTSESQTDEERIDSVTISFLSRAGASDSFLTLLLTETDDVEGVDRHSIRQEVERYIRTDKIAPDADPEEFYHIGGGFFSKMWDGDVYDAFCHADGNNKRLMLEAFGEARINAFRSNPRSPAVEDLTRIV